MKRSYFRVLSAVVLVSLFAMGIGASSAIAKPAITIPTEFQAVAGETVVIPIELTGMTTENIGAFGLRLNYDDTVLTNPKSVTAGTLTATATLDEAAPPKDGIGDYTVGIGFGFSATADGTLVKVQFDVAEGFSGTSAISFEDVGGKTSLSTAAFAAIDTDFVDGSIIPKPPNSAPTATAGTLSVDEDGSAEGTLAGTDPDGDSMTFSIVADDSGTKGTAVIDDAATGAYTYTPTANENGEDTFTFKANDGTVDSAAATVTVTISAQPDAPTTQGGTLAVTEDTPTSGTLTAVDVDGDTLAYTFVQGSKGVAAITDAATGAYTYAPNANENGEDTFTFTVNDGTADSNSSVVTVTITAVNDTPTVTDGTLDATIVGGSASGTLVGNDVDDGDTLTYTVTTQGTQGTVGTIGADGSYTYTLNAGAVVGEDTFKFKANDGTVDSEEGTVTVTITLGNKNPVANDVTLDPAYLGEATSGTLDASDEDVGDILTYSLVTPASKGVAVVDAAGTYTYTTLATASDGDTDTFTYQAIDDKGGESNTATVTVKIVEGNTPPEAKSTDLTATAGEETTGTLVATDADEDALTYTITQQPEKGQVTLVGATYTYTANDTTEPTTDTFFFTVDDGKGGTDEGTITVNIVPAGEYSGADMDRNYYISLSELLSVQQLYTSGAYHCDPDEVNDDGYGTGDGDQTCTAHTSDYNPQDWEISLSEFLRTVQFYNLLGYHVAPEGVDSEDGFVAGPE